MTGIGVVQRVDDGAHGDLLVLVCCRHGRLVGGPAQRHVGQFPALPDAQQLPSNGM